MSASWDNVTFGNEKRTRIDELISIVDYRKNKKFTDYRYIGDLVKYAVQWLPIYKDGKPVKSQATGKAINIPFNVTNFDPETGQFDTSKTCPFVEVGEKIASYIKDEKEAKQFKVSTGFYAQAISRKLQENPDSTGKPSKAERASGFKESLDSSSFTPVQVHPLNYTIGQGIETARELNTVKLKGSSDKVAKSIADPKFGCDIMIKYNDQEKGQGKYKVQKGERTPLTEEEEKYLLWDVVAAIKATTISRKEAKIEAERILAEFMKSVKKKKSSDDEDDDDTDDMPDDLEDDSPASNKKKKKKAGWEDDEDSPKAKKKKKVEDEDEEDDDSPAPTKNKKKKVVDEDEDEDDSPEPVKKKKKKVEEDSPAPAKKKKKPAVEEESPVPTKKKKKAVEEDEDDDDDDDDDEFELDDLEDDDDD